MPPFQFNLASIKDLIERRYQQKSATPRYSAVALEGFITPRWKAKKQMAVECIDFNQSGAGLKVSVPIWEKGDEVCLYVRASDKTELKLHGMPATVRYRIKWEGQYRIGLEFHPQKALFREQDVKLQACAVETYLAELSGKDPATILDGITLDKAISANDTV
ncbi:PilZ domain-containing protein [Marinobacter sp. F3R08]|uniref:PilZ domain-containing protein n=1 Tax=Marinobacter sp. F3R08 TaxID=2841559 RepID=UPI001C0A2158|nr:PilZ domain-containing protein [Marinobacter sp. F3R08]MBU2952285.1 PilZ domain-containing protein [Marinobacter sp. F3R08]